MVFNKEKVVNLILGPLTVIGRFNSTVSGQMFGPRYYHKIIKDTQCIVYEYCCIFLVYQFDDPQYATYILQKYRVII
jgi:hypothetical protein